MFILQGWVAFALCGLSVSVSLAEDIQVVNPRRTERSRVKRSRPRPAPAPVSTSTPVPVSTPAPEAPAPAPQATVAPTAPTETGADPGEKVDTTVVRPTPTPSPRPSPRPRPTAKATPTVKAAPRPAPRPVPAAKKEKEVDLSKIDSTPSTASRREKEVDLSSMGAASASTSVTTSGARPVGSGTSVSQTRNFHGSGILPNFKFYYDFLLRYWPKNPGGTGDLSFESYHQRFMVEYMPYPELLFAAEISSQPLFFELDYNITPRFQIRWGKIWIPFDDLSPHNLFGGRVNTTTLASSSNELTFLPDIWAEPGVAIKYVIKESYSVSTDLHLYVTNGFRDGKNDPKGELPNGAYPDFAGYSAAGTLSDNNNDKAVGGRIVGKFSGQLLSAGLSGYRSVYTDKGQPKKNITLLGADFQFRPNNRLETRVGLLSGKVGLPAPATKDSFTRGGTYLEQGVKFGGDLSWKALVRAGTVQADNRVIDSSDKKIVGFTLLKRIRSLEFSLHVDRDLKRVATKTGYTYSTFRAVAAF